MAAALDNNKHTYQSGEPRAEPSDKSSLRGRAVEWIKEYSNGIATIAIIAGTILAITAGILAVGAILAAPVTIPLACVGWGLVVIGLITELGMEKLNNQNTLHENNNAQETENQDVRNVPLNIDETQATEDAIASEDEGVDEVEENAQGSAVDSDDGPLVDVDLSMYTGIYKDPLIPDVNTYF